MLFTHGFDGEHHIEIRSWNHTVLNNEGDVSFSRTEDELLVGLELTDTLVLCVFTF